MFINGHRTRAAAASVPPRPVFSDNLLSVIPMSGSISDLSGAAMIAWFPLDAFDDPDDPQSKENPNDTH